MTKGQPSGIWAAEHHTIAKIEILKAYLVACFQILGKKRPGQPFLYIDGFAGPNQYANGQSGSPSVALDAARTAIANSADKWKAGTIQFAFIESDAKMTSSQRPYPALGNWFQLHLFQITPCSPLSTRLDQQVLRSNALLKSWQVHARKSS
jgi:hypothetical protein